LATEGGDSREYNPALRPVLEAEMVRVLRAFGYAQVHVLVLGGLVPSLLVPTVEAGIAPHVGTQDLDLCLSVALVEGNVGNYERLESCLRQAQFEMARDGDHPVSWRWKRTAGFPLVVEFFCPPGEGREVGRLFRPGGVVGGKLSALVLAAGNLIDLDARDVEIEADLPDGGGRTRHRLKVAGPAAYLASKADALRGRNKNKDAYDIIWLAESWPGGQPALAVEIRASPVFQSPEFRQALMVLAAEFETIDSAGAVKYGRFMAAGAAAIDLHSRRAVGAMRSLLSLLGPGEAVP